MRYPLLFTLLSLTAGDCFSQAPEPVEVRTASHSDGTCSVEWDTVSNHTYFMQVSPDLTKDSWRYLPVIESGDGQSRRYGLQDPSGRGFFRLHYTSQLVVGPVGEFDFDGDGYGSMDELTILNTDPLNVDSNGDGTLDGQEDTDNDGVEDGYELLISAASGADNYIGLHSISLANAGTAGRLTGQGDLRGTGEGDVSEDLPPINVWTQSRSFRVSTFDPNPTGHVSNEFFVSESGSPSELHPYIDVAHFYEFEANRPPADARALQSFDGFDFPADEEEEVSSIKWENDVENVIGEGDKPIVESQEEWHRERPSISEEGVDTGSNFRKHQFRLVADRVITEEDAPVKAFFFGVRYQRDDAGEIVNVETTDEDVTLEIPVGKDRSPAHEPVPEQHDGFTHATLPVDLAVDGNHDGEVTFDGGDIVSNEEPFHFWINDDKDSGNNAAAEDTDPNDRDVAEDSEDDTIHCLRDLEDFAQLALNAGAIAELINANAIEVGFRFVDVQEGNPRIRLYHANGQGFEDGEFNGKAYLEDETAAIEQMNHANAYHRVDTGKSPLDTLPKSFFSGDFFPKVDSGNPLVRFIFEGISAGEGTLALVIKTDDGTESEIPLVPMKLSKVTDMYEHWTVGDTTMIDISAIPTQPSKTSDSGSYTEDSSEEDDCIVFVHGWRMLLWERRYFASTSYKRLWHQGFKGRFFHFSWPTEWTDRPAGFFRDILGNPPEDPDNYADSEEKAYYSATGLRALLTDLKSQYGANAVRMFSHSMGGVVASEALLQHSKTSGGGTLLNTFAPCQAAMAAHAYDQTAQTRAASALNLGSWDTPEVYASYQFTPATQYFNGITRAGAIVNFHNHEDDALDGWVSGQDLKPNWNIIPEDYNYGVPVLGGPESFYHRPDFQGPRYLDLLNDVHEIYAHVAEARSFALGAEGVNAFPAVDLNNAFSKAAANFSDTSEDHSAQFRGTNMIRYEFWHTLLEEFNLLPDTVE